MRKKNMNREIVHSDTERQTLNANKLNGNRTHVFSIGDTKAAIGCDPEPLMSTSHPHH